MYVGISDLICIVAGICSRDCLNIFRGGFVIFQPLDRIGSDAFSNSSGTISLPEFSFSSFVVASPFGAAEIFLL